MKRLRSLFWWHRFAGLLAAVFVLLLATTGILLNHVEALGLDRHRAAAWTGLAAWYGIEAPPTQGPYRAGAHELALLPPKLFVNGQRVAGDFERLHGVVDVDGLLIVASDQGLLLLDPVDAATDSLDAPWRGSPVQRLGRGADDAVVLQVGGQLFRSPTGLQDWQQAESAAGVRWSEALAAPANVDYPALFLSDAVTWERIIADLHSGRLFGINGRVLMDVAAVAMIFLALSGFLLWRRQQHHQRKRRRQSRH